MYKFIETQLNNSNYLKGSLEIVKETFSNREEEISISKFKDWWLENNITYKGNPTSFLKYHLKRELDAGTFDKTFYCYKPLYEMFEQNNILIFGDDDGYISAMFDYLLDEGLLKIDELITFNKKAINVVAGKTTREYIEVWKKSKVAKERGFNWEHIDEIAKKRIDFHRSLIEELSK